jgi:LL-diaminopimelate aminotransferase
VVAGLREIGLDAVAPKAGLYIWTKTPPGYDSASFAKLLLDERDIVVTPGRGYGLAGEGYIRLSLTTPDDRIEEGLRRLRGWRPPPPKGSA